MRPILRAFLAVTAASTSTVLGACGEGESGLVLGRPLPVQSGGTAALPPAGDAGGPGATGAGASGAMDAGGAAGEPNAPVMNDPTWIQERCTPKLTFQNTDTTSKGQVFSDAVPDPQTLVWSAAHDTCRTLYRFPDDVKPIEELTLTVQDYAGVAGVTGSNMYISTSYLQSQLDQGVDIREEVAGILHFTTSLVYQNPGPQWLSVGIADYVRLDADLLGPQPRKGGTYYQSSRATAFFLQYLVTRNADIVYQLNRRLAPEQGAWTDQAFVTFMGSDVDTLWSDYQATLPE
jgi:hypothetical protein